VPDAPAPLDPPPLDPNRLFAALAAQGVRYVLIGGIALNLLGLTTPTLDVDLCYDAAQANARALLRALRSLDAVPVDADNRPVAAQSDARALHLHDTFLFVTAAGRVDCLRVPDGTSGYDDLARTALAYDVDGVAVVVASVQDMLRMKRATDRPKDRIALEALGALADELDGLP
jgi:hypothetical protein